MLSRPRILSEQKSQNPETPSLNKLELDLLKDRSNWHTSLNNLVDYELEVIADNCDAEKMLVSLEALIKGELENFSQDEAIKKNFVNILDLLTLQQISPLYDSLISRDKRPFDVSFPVDMMRLAALLRLEKNYLAKGGAVSLTPEVKNKIVFNENIFFIQDKKYKYEEMLNLLDKQLALYTISCDRTRDANILGHLLLRYANINECPLVSYAENFTRSHQGHLIYSPGNFFLEFNLSDENIRRFFHFYAQSSELNCMEFAARSKDRATHAFCVNINTIVKIILSDAFKTLLTQHLSNTMIRENYRLIVERKETSYEKVTDSFEKLGKQYHMSSHGSDFVETSIIHAFGIREPLTAARSQASRDFVDFITHTHCYLSITEEAAKSLASAINLSFVDAAKFISSHAQLPTKADIHFCIVAIKSSVLIRNDFQQRLSEALEDIKKHHIDLYETLQLGGGVRIHTSKQLAASLQQIATEMKESDPRLTTSIRNFSVFVAQHKPTDELQDASFELEKAIAAHESKCETKEEYDFFKKNKKREIKNIQEELGARCNKKVRFSV